MDRRTSLQWMLAATALPSMGGAVAAVSSSSRAKRVGTGTDPNLVKSYAAGDLWPLSLGATQLRIAATLCRVIIPADDRSPSAADLNVHVFIDEWISAPYPKHVVDRTLIVEGLAWLDLESQSRFQVAFADADPAQHAAICDDICWTGRTTTRTESAARFFARFRDLTAAGFYTTPAGSKDLRYAGNIPSLTFDGPPPEALKIVGVS